MNANDLINSWHTVLKDEFHKDYMKSLNTFLSQEKKSKKITYPNDDEIFSALNNCPFEKVKVVIIGQDPYHGESQAHGMSFSVKKGNKVPPSLKNIYKEQFADLGITQPEHGFLESWANQGVLLLNNVLTVRKSSPGSHRKKGWEQFTDIVIDHLNEEKNNLVFMLWGNDAKTKCMKIDREKHLVLESAHPSPFSVTKFRGNNHFSKCNEFLKSKNIEVVNWQLT